MTGPQTETGILAGGDTTAPDRPGREGADRPEHANALLVEFREAIGPPSATNVANYDYDSGTCR